MELAQKPPSKPPPKRPKSSQHKGMTLHPPLASLARLPNGELRVPSPLARYASMRPRASSVADYNSGSDRQEIGSSPERSSSTSPQYLVGLEVIRSSMFAAQKSFQSRVRAREWVPDGSQENVPREFLELTQQRKSSDATSTEALLDPLARDRVATLRATLEQLFFRLQTTDQLQTDPVFGPDTGADLELGECNMPIEDITKFTTEILQPEDSSHPGSNFDTVTSSNKSDPTIQPTTHSAIPTSFALSKPTDTSHFLRSNAAQNSKPPDHDIISQDHDGEINDFLLGDACKIGNLLTPLPSVELDKQIVSFSDKQGLSEMDIFGLAFDTCLDYLSNYNRNGQIAEILQTLSRVKAYYVKRIKSTPTQLAAYQEAANILDSKLQVTVRDLKEATHENQDLRIRLTTLKGNYTEAVKRIDELVCQNTMQARDMTILTRRLNVAQDQVSQLSFTLDMIKSELLDERNKTKRLAATANRFKSNLERVGDRAAQAERKANYGELQILDLEKQKKTMMAEMAMLQEQLSTITGAFAKERGALVSENERLTMENNDFQTTLASGGMFFASGAEDGEANSEVLVRVANKIHKRTDMSPHAKLAATTILRLCAEDSRVACRRLGITNDGLSSIMWLVTAAKNSDNVATFLTHLHGQYSSYFVAKGTAVQTKDSYVMDAKAKRKKKAADAVMDTVRNLRLAAPNEEPSGSAENRIYTSFDNEFTDASAPSTSLLLRKSHNVLLNMHRQLQIYRDKYEHLPMDSDKDFNELQTLLAEYYQGKEYNERSSVTTCDVYQRPSCRDCPSAPCDSDFDHLNQFGSPKGDDALLDNGSGEFLTRSLDKEFASTQLEERTHHSSTIPSMHPSKTVPARNDQMGARTTAPEKDFLQQGETLPPNLSMESVDFGGQYASSQLIDESTEFFVDAESHEEHLQINSVDTFEETVKAANAKITSIASLATTQEQKDKVILLLQNLLYKSKYNSSILQVFDEYANRLIRDNNQVKELLLQQRNGNDLDASTDKANSPEAVAANETTNGILKLSQVLDNLFDERSPISDELVQKDNQQASIEVLLDANLSMCTKETINWVVDQIRSKAERARRKKAIKHQTTPRLTATNKRLSNPKALGVSPGRKPLPSACTSARQTQRMGSQGTQLEKDVNGTNHSCEYEQLCEEQNLLTVDGKVNPMDNGEKYLYYKDASGNLCAVKHSIVRSGDGYTLHESRPSSTDRSAHSEGISFQLSSSTQRRLSAKDCPTRGTSSPAIGSIVDLNTIALGSTPPVPDLPSMAPAMLLQSKRVGSPAKSTDSRQSSLRLKSGSPSKRHFYGLSTQNILARVSENIRGKSWSATRPLSSPLNPGYPIQQTNKSEPGLIVQTSDGAISFVDTSSVKKGTSELMSIMEKDNRVLTNDIYYVERTSTSVVLATFNPDDIPKSLSAAIDRQETILIENNQDTVGKAQIPLTIFFINDSINPLLSPPECIENASAMFLAHPLPQELAGAVKMAIGTATIATQTTPMVLDEIISTGDLLVNDAFSVIEKLFTAMHADPLQMEQTPVQTPADVTRIDSIPIDNDNAIDLTMSRFTNIPLFPDIYMTEQLIPQNDSQANNGGGKVPKDIKQTDDPVTRTSPLLSLLQRSLPTSLPLVTRGLLGPSGITKYSDDNSPDHLPLAQQRNLHNKEQGLSDLKAASERPKTAINTSSPITSYLKSMAKSQFNPDSDVKDTADIATDMGSPSAIQQLSPLDGCNLSGSTAQPLDTALRCTREDMALSMANDDLVDNNSRTYKETVLELLSVSQRHKSLPSQRLRQSIDANKFASETIRQKNSIAEGSLLIESLTPEEARGGRLLLFAQQQSRFNVGPGKESPALASTTERTALQNRRLENKILNHHIQGQFQPQLSSTTFIKTKQDNTYPQGLALTYSEYLHARGRDSRPSYTVTASHSGHPYLRLHPRHGQNVLFTQCNPLEPPEGPLLQFVGGTFEALVTKFGSFKRHRCTLPHELLELAHSHSDDSQVIYPCVLSSNVDLVDDFSSNASKGEEQSPQNRQATRQKMQKTFEYLVETIKHLPSRTITEEDITKPNDSLTDGFRITAKQFSKTKLLIPRPGDTVLYLRHSALNVRKNDSRSIFPTILQLLQELSPHRCELFTIETGSAVDIMHKTYIRIPIANAYLKSSIWTLKLIRAIYSSRINMEESYVTIKEPVEHVLTVSLKDEGRGNHEVELDSVPDGVGGADITKADSTKGTDSRSRSFSFDVVHGGLSRQEAESLPHFLLYYAKNKYGVIAIVTSLLWSLIVSVCYHQYENNEIYLFARFLFGDLDFDFYLTYLDIQRALGGLHRDAVDLVEVPELLQAILPNWSSKRRYSLCESIYSCRLVQRSKQAYTIDIVHLSQMILVAYGGYRRSLFESMTLVWSKISTENFLTEGKFREFCDTCVTLLSFNSVTEVFYAFSVEYKDDTSVIAQSGIGDQPAVESCALADAVHDLSCRRMYYANFIDFYLSYCLGRYAIISSLTLDEVMRGTSAKRNIQLASKVYERLVALSQDIATKKLSSADIEEPKAQKQELVKAIRKVFNHLNLASCDISAYDSQRAIDNMRQGINLLTDCCMDAKSEAASIVLGGGVAALSAFIVRNH